VSILTPVIIRKDTGSYCVRCDGELVLSTVEEHFTPALEAWLACFWIFSIEYPKQLANTMLYIERALLGCKGGRMPAIVTQWSARLASK
jgi:hypothetical protein